MAPKYKTAAQPSRRVTKSRERKAAKPMKAIFAGKHFTFSEKEAQDSQFTHENMARWIIAHGGEVDREVTEDTTHLICTIEDFKKRTSQVRKAWRLGNKCNIIVRDWLEDCLIVSEASKKRCRAEKGYTLDRVIKRGKQTLERQQQYRQSFEAGVKAGHELVDNRLNHIYVDQTGFEYKIVLTRINTFGKVQSEKYTLYLFESHAKPSHYMFGAKLSSTCPRRTSFYRQDCKPALFAQAFAYFQHFFKDKTGIEWNDRMEGYPQVEEKFKYNVPEPGRPVGVLPSGKLKRHREKSTDSGVGGMVWDSDSNVTSSDEDTVQDDTMEVDDSSNCSLKSSDDSSDGSSETEKHDHISISSDDTSEDIYFK